MWQQKVENYQKMENYKLKKCKTFWKHTCKWKKKMKFGDIEIQKQKLHQHKRPISIKQIQILIK